jgi:5-bromo-4-chloroindolyl phosphate hydrolysis protein
MISEFQDLSDKIERLAELVVSLRSENAQLRQTNLLLNEVNTALIERIVEVQHKVEAVIEQLPAPEVDEDFAADADADAEPIEPEAAR